MSLSSSTSITDPHPAEIQEAPRRRATYQVRTFGCQMNVHDSERLTGMLEESGYVPAAEGADPRHGEVDIVVFNTCAVRENADKKLYGTLGSLRPGKDANPGMQIAVGGCLAQKDRAAIVERAPWVDVVFGTHNIGSLPVLLDRARHNAEAQVEILESLEVFPSTLPTRRESSYAAWVSISVGCNNTCTFCIVPSLRGKEKDRRPGDVLAEVRDRGGLRRPRGDPAGAERELLRRGVRRPRRFREAAACRAGRSRGSSGCDSPPRTRRCSPTTSSTRWRETPNVMPQLHMPLQSGSDDVLRRMKRSYRSKKFLGILEQVQEHDPGGSDHDGHHRRLPRGDGGRFRAHARCGRGVPLLQRLHLPVLDPPRAPPRRPWTIRSRRRSCRSASSGSTALAGPDLPRGEPEARGARRRDPGG